MLNPKTYHQLAPLGRGVGALFLLLSAAMNIAGAGWFQRKLWAWRLAVIIISTQVAGDLVNCFRGEYLAGATGFFIAGALLVYLLTPKMKAHFFTHRADEDR